MKYLRPFSNLILIISISASLAACGGDNNNISNSNNIPLQDLVIDVPSALVTPEYTLNGGLFALSEYNDGNFLLRDVTESSDQPFLGSSHFANPDPVRIVQGTYDVLYQHETGDSVPLNVDGLVQTTGLINSDQDLPIAVIAWLVTPSFKLNGGAFPVTEYDDARFYLKPATGGERIFLGNSHTANPDALWLMPGTYDVIYELETGGTNVPNNQSAVVMSGESITNSGILAVDVTMVDFSFDASLDSNPFPASQYQRAMFFLRNTSSGDLVELGVSYELPVRIRVIEGTYDIVYSHVQGDQLPANIDAVLESGVVIGSGGVSAKDIPITSVEITPSFTLNGGNFPVSEYNDGNFYLRGASPEDVLFLGASEDNSPDLVRVIPGDYDVLYRHETGTQVPQNANAELQTGVVLNADGPLPVPVTMISVSGMFTLNGNNFPADETESVQFLLRDAADVSDEFIFGFSDINNGAVKLIPGTYDVVIEHVDGDSVPQNVSRVVQSSVLLDSDQSLPVNATVKRIGPTFTLDGMDFPASIYQSATFYLRDNINNDQILLARSYNDNDEVIVVNGNYDVIYEHLFGEQTPQNTNSVVGSILVQ